MVQRAELGAFLRARREASDPVAAGFGAGPRRRTPGLRREELAQLAGLSVTWYTWLEQARDISVSRPVVDSLARALGLTPAERAHLFTLAGLALPPVDASPPVVEPTLARLVDVLHPHPAYVANSWWDVLACNDAYAGMIGGLAHRPVAERNILWITFVDARESGHLLDWQAEARALVGQLRGALARHPHDPRGAELLDALLTADATFREMWAEHTIVPFETARKRIRHPTLGRLDLDYTKLIAATDERQMVIAFLPADAETATRLGTLGTEPAPLLPGFALLDVPSGGPAGVEPDPAVPEAKLRPCDFCGHPVEVESIDEYDCPVCGEAPAGGLGDEPGA